MPRVYGSVLFSVCVCVCLLQLLNDHEVQVTAFDLDFNL